MTLDYEPIPKDELLALGDADLDIDNDPLATTILTALTRLHMSDLIFGGSTFVIDPSGWTKGTLPAAAVYIAQQVRLHMDTQTTLDPAFPDGRGNY